MEWIEGPVCGEDNCPSKWYRIVHGLYECSNGHVGKIVEEEGDANEIVSRSNIRKTTRIESSPNASSKSKKPIQPQLNPKTATKLYLLHLGKRLKHLSFFLIEKDIHPF